MTSIFNLVDDENISDKINIDELYERKRIYDLNKLYFFKKILNRVHVRIKNTSKINIHNKFCWFVVPEIIIGYPKYDQPGCIAYIIDSLKQNGFNVRYFHPNTLLISWNHWIPLYVRNEIKKKTGVEINQFGETIYNEEDTEQPQETQNKYLTSTNKNNKKNNYDNLNYTPISNYKPSGNFDF